ncbi:MAG: 30S ribosomal protein S18 [Candidatus Vidania fulgoroideorum]
MIDYKNLKLLRQFIDINYKIVSRKLTKFKLTLQRKLAKSIKIARYLAFLPYVDK